MRGESAACLPSPSGTLDLSGISGDAARRAKIFIARDHLGIKPLYYAYSDGALCLASEVRALIADRAYRAAHRTGFAEAYLLIWFCRGTVDADEVSSPCLPVHFLMLSADAPFAFAQALLDFSSAALHTDGPRPKNLSDAAKHCGRCWKKPSAIT